MKTRLKELRLEQNLTIKQLANETGLDFTAISRYENDNRKIPIESLDIFSAYFNVSRDYIMGDSLDQIKEKYKNTIKKF